MKRIFGLTIVALLLTACAAIPQLRNSTEPRPASNSSAAEGDLTLTYRRSQVEAKQPGPFQDFGLVDGERITLTMNGTLIDEQAPQVCDDRPVRKIVTPPARQRRCMRSTIQGCAQYEGEPQPPCESDLSLGRLLYGRSGECMKRADPNAPTITYKTAPDCYRAQPSRQSLGQVTLYAVPDGTARGAVRQRGRALGTFNLAGSGSSQTVNIGGQTRPGECLALADSTDTPLSVRQTGDASRAHLFMTPQMAGEKERASLQAKASEAQGRAETARAEAERQARYARDSGAWTGRSCTAPPMAAMPPRPAFMSAKDAAIQARAACYFSLTVKYDRDNEVFKAVTSEQRYEYLEAERAVKGSGINKLLDLDHCTRGAYSFKEDELAYLRDEVFQNEFGKSTTIPEGIARGLGGLFVGTTTTVEKKQKLIVRMLQQCTSATARTCSEPQVAYSERVQAIREAPQKALQACEDAARRGQSALADALLADKEAKALAAQLAARPETRSGPVVLSAAACGM